MKTRFVVIGSGWRAMYYARIAKALPERFECAAMLCRKAEKKERLEQEEGIHAVLTREECLRETPDFAVIAVDKMHMSETAMEWSHCLPVLMETPAAADADQLDRMMEFCAGGAEIAVAEQYRSYARHIARKKIVKEGLIGESTYLYLSEAHEYHGASLMRYYLDLPREMPFVSSAREWAFPTAETLSRQERFTDGRIADKTRRLAVFEFENGKTCVYDFDSEQYRSPIRRNLFKLQGVRGEMINETVRWLDGENLPREESMQVSRQLVITQNPNPNFSRFYEITGIEFNHESVYAPPFGKAGLSEDETAIAVLLEKMRDYAKGEGENPYPLEEALADSYMALCMKESLRTKKPVHADGFSAFRK